MLQFQRSGQVQKAFTGRRLNHYGAGHTAIDLGAFITAAFDLKPSAAKGHLYVYGLKENFF